MTDNIIAIILGAHEWPKSPAWTSSSAFTKSAEGFKYYLLNPHGMNIPAENLLYLFDDNREMGQIDEAIGTFIDDRRKKLPSLDTLIVYYTGHGAFTDGDQKYCLALHCTRINSLGTTAYRVSSLARVINNNIGDARKYIILDSCYAGAALPDFLPQSDAASRMEANTMDAIADAGTALLCACSSADVALVPRLGEYTMFSGALLNTLNKGSENRPRTLSFDDIRQMTWSKILEIHKDDSVAPEVHIPDQRKGDISKVGFFPNLALIPPPADDRILNMERQISALNNIISDIQEKIELINIENLSSENRNHSNSRLNNKELPKNIPPSQMLVLSKMAHSAVPSMVLLNISFFYLIFEFLSSFVTGPNLNSSQLNIWFRFLESRSFNFFLDISSVFITIFMILLVFRKKDYPDYSIFDTDGKWRNEKYVLEILSKSYVLLPGNLIFIANYFYSSIFIFGLSSLIAIVTRAVLLGDIKSFTGP